MKRLSTGSRVRVLWRSLFIQAGFNPEGLQALGLLYSVQPALLELYPDGPERDAAFRRHLTTFNTHPYISAAIVGGILYYEQRIASGELPPESVARFKGALMGPLAAIGDGFFWLSLRPAVGAAAAAAVLLVDGWAAPMFLVLYNGVALTLRARFFSMGFRLGADLVNELAKARLPERGQQLRSIAAALCGVVGAASAAHLPATLGLPEKFEVPAAVGAFAFGGAAAILARFAGPTTLMYAAAALAVAMGAIVR